VNSLEAVLTAMRSHGVARVYFKRLAANDNSKNQIYLGSGFKALNTLPTGGIRAVPSGTGGREVFHAAVRLEWLTPEGMLSPAPEAKLILYPQYPEVRLSAFLLRSPGAPSAVLAGRATGRMLLLGITGDQRVVGYATSASTSVSRQLEALAPPHDCALHAIDTSVVRPRIASREGVIDALRAVHLRGWIDSHRLAADGESLPCKSPHCGGLTLEAELGIVPNGRSEPDYLGWEIKQIGTGPSEKPVGAVTLMTPEPDGGYYRTAGVEAFIRRYGYQDRRGRADRLNFGGVHAIGLRSELTGLALTLAGFDTSNCRITDASGEIRLVAPSGDVAASWAFSKLMAHWGRKHANALYATSQRRSVPRRQYRYGSRIWLGTGTDFLRLLKSMASATVYYDPGMKLLGASTQSPSTKRRSQFRVKFAGVPALYETFEQVQLES